MELKLAGPVNPGFVDAPHDGVLNVTCIAARCDA